MESALRIFAEKGFQAATIAEVSKAAGVSEPTVYEHFGTKEDLLFAIPQKVLGESIELFEKILPYVKGTEARIRAMMRIYVHTYINNPHFTAVALLELASNKKFRQTKASATVRRAAQILLEAIREGIKNGTFQADANPYLIRSMLLGTVEHLFIQRHMRGAPAKDGDIMALLDPFLDMVFDGVRAKKEAA